MGMEVRLEGNRILVTHLEIGGAAAAAGVKSGWILEAIDGERLAETLKGLRKGVSEQKAKVLAWSAVEHALRGAPDSVARLAFLDERDRPVTLSLRRKPETGEPVSLGNLPKLFAHSEFETLRSPGGLAVGYLHFNMWMLPAAMAVNQAMEEFRGAGGIVVDMRGNIGGIGMMVMGVAGHFVDEPVSLGTMKMRGNELHILANPRRVGLRGERVEPYAGPVAILVDDISLSAAEIFAGGMQAIGRARIFGETSAGQALPSSLNRLPNGDILYHAIADFVTPNGTRLEGRGVIPDERVPLRRKDLLEGRDGALRAALQWIENETKSGRKAK